MSPRDPDSESLRRLRRIADRAALVASILGRQPSLVSSADIEIAAKAGTVVSVVSEVMRALAEWGWLQGTGSPRYLSVGSDRLMALSWRLQGVADCTAMDVGPPIVEPVVTLPMGAQQLRAALQKGFDAHATRDGFAHVAANARNRLVFLVPFMDTMGADVLVSMLHSTPATERVVVVRPDSRGIRWYSPHLSAFHSVRTRVLEYWHSGLPQGSRRHFTQSSQSQIANSLMSDLQTLCSRLSDDSLECGVLLRGRPVQIFGALIDAVLAISTLVLASD